MTPQAAAPAAPEELHGQRWIVVADSPFLPAHGGGEREHLGFVQAAARRGLISALVIPTDDDPQEHGRQDDHAALRELVSPAPCLFVPRRRAAWAAANPRRPYVVGSRPAPRGIARDLAAMAADATGVVLFSYKSHQLGKAIATGLGLPAVLRTHNLEGAYHAAIADAAAGARKYAFRLEAARIELDERRLDRASWLSGVADISASDAAIRRRRSRIPVEYVPSFALGDPAEWREEKHLPPATPTLVFVGALDVSTNHEAISWFGSTVWPIVSARLPDASWHVVGRRPPPWLREQVAGWPSVQLHADVPDPREHLRSATLAINPAVSGSGVNIKLVEYLAMGLPVVSTSRGMQGLGLEAGTHLEVADDPQQFANRVLTLLTDPGRARELGESGQSAALTLLDSDRGLVQLASMLRTRR